ncbi:dihydrofolate reductase [Larsenimonas rhizosphaerae]|uniref:Dihydrofolate reductase n=1 Tax=Larsenimonas rhizosphaerae TaxID=2944682 RepID=A0AA41ZHI5_9GAMM|nr:dihydrofolate reductase [Larsenimonas rhizosphaerae]MCM2131903.1 dihydrofolate reductase [Larsenimonas rhizosphaerae]MCX2524791.1 dihydrofolate reductase [Larsenimonas rhizosphaerae]
MKKHSSSDDTVVPVAMIVAMSRNRVIGVDGKLPWYLPEDLKFFKAATQGKPLVMGRATFESIGKPLPNRLNIVVTRNTSFSHDGVRVCHDLATAIEVADHQAMLDGSEEIMVIGGGNIYGQALDMTQRLYVTEVNVDIQGDTWFPPLTDTEWTEVERVAGSPTPQQPDYDFVRYERTSTIND